MSEEERANVVLWDADRFKRAARVTIASMALELEDEDWDELEKSARVVYRCMLARREQQERDAILDKPTTEERKKRGRG